MAIEIRPFQPEDQVDARALILDGLVEHWGYLDESKNPELDDIAASYAAGTFLVAWMSGEIVGTGACMPCSDSVVEIVRMSVRKDVRRRGIGGAILIELCVRAKQLGYRKLILETTRTWKEVILFYRKFGFQFTHFEADDAYFSLDLTTFPSLDGRGLMTGT